MNNEGASQGKSSLVQPFGRKFYFFMSAICKMEQLWNAATRRRFESADMSAQSKVFAFIRVIRGSTQIKRRLPKNRPRTNRFRPKNECNR
jgi:hypothetical protein